jgi:hypothetical protein
VQPAYGGGFDAFVAKLTPDGTALVYATYLGGSDSDSGEAIAVDFRGSAYVTGSTNSSDFPTRNPLQSTLSGFGGDAFVAKLSPNGAALVYATYLGGRAFDFGVGIAVDFRGSAYVTGSTNSSDFLTRNALQPAFGAGTPRPPFGSPSDAFVAKLAPAGSELVYSTYLGGSASDGGSGIAVDFRGNAYVTGSTNSSDFPIQDPLQPAFGGGTPRPPFGSLPSDAFVAKLAPNGTALVYSTYLGGSDYDVGSGIAVDLRGNAYVTGDTSSADFPTRDALQPGFGGGTPRPPFGSPSDAFVAKLAPTGAALVYSTYLGGSDEDSGSGITVDFRGSAYVTGRTSSADFPTRDPLQSALGGGFADAFVAKLSPNGAALVYSTYLGGNDSDRGEAIAVDFRGGAYVTGGTGSADFPTRNALQPAFGGLGDAFVTKLSTPTR